MHDKRPGLPEVTGWILVILTFSLVLAGCGGIIARRTYQDLTPEEIRAVTESGAQVTSCFGAGGPPVGGRSLTFSYPYNAVGKVRFGPDCQLLEAEVELRGRDYHDPAQDPPIPFKPNPQEFNPNPRVIQPPPKMKTSDDAFKLLKPIPVSGVGKASGAEPFVINDEVRKAWSVPKPDPCNFIGATGARWVFCADMTEVK